MENKNFCDLGVKFTTLKINHIESINKFHIEQKKELSW